MRVKKPEEVDRKVILYTGSHDLRRKIADSSRDAYLIIKHDHRHDLFSSETPVGAARTPQKGLQPRGSL